MAEEDPDTYIKRMRTYYNNEEQRTLWKSHPRDKQQRLRDLENKRHNAEKEYQKRKAAQRAAATAAASGGSSSGCFATYPDASPQANAVADVLTPLGFGLLVFVAMMLRNRTRPLSTRRRRA